MTYATEARGQGISYYEIRQCVAYGTAMVVAPLREGEEGWTRQSAANAMR